MYLHYLYDVLSYEGIIVLVTLISFIISYLTIPRIQLVVKLKRLMDSPNHRSSHKELTPTMGGIAFFASLLLSLFFIDFYDEDNLSMGLIAGLLVLFYIGLKDDLIGVAPKTKIGGQILSTLFAMTSISIGLFSFDGFLWLDEIPVWFSCLLSIGITVSIVNAYNLIDGINGLASMVGIVIFAAFGYIFYLSDNQYYVLLSASSIGFLLAFLRYNISKRKKKNIFMGDTGSMIVGFVISICSLKLLGLSHFELQKAGIFDYNKFGILLAILFIPSIDTARVFIIRVFKKRSPFFADRNHTHHIAIDYMKLTHKQASLLLSGLNLLVFGLIYWLNYYIYPLLLFSILLLIFVGITLLLFYFNRSYAVRKKKHKVQKIINKVVKNNSKRGDRKNL